jgi:hypothetical protein
MKIEIFLNLFHTDAFSYGDWYSTCGKSLFFSFQKVHISSRGESKSLRRYALNEKEIYERSNSLRQAGRRLGTSVAHLE